MIEIKKYNKSDIRIRSLREELDLKQYEMANILNMNKDTYSNYERNRGDIPLEKMNEIANFFHTTFDYILNLSNKRTIITKKLNIDYDKLKTRLKKLRKEKHLSQTALGNKVGFYQKTYSNYEIGINKPTVFKLLAIAQFHNVSMDYLCGRIDNQKIDRVSKTKKKDN